MAEALPGPSLVLSGDVTDEDFNEAVADATVAEWGGVDAWICNAGISPIVAGPRQTEASVWRQILEVNLTGAFLGARAAARVMGEGGRLIFTGSVLGRAAAQGPDRLQRSKAGLVGVAKGLALDLAPAGITVNVVAPGWFDSPLADGWKQQPRALGRHHRTHGATALGSTRRPGRRLPVPGLRRLRLRHRHRAQRRRRIPAGMTTTRRVVAITGAGGALGAAVSQQLAGEPATDLVLSDVSAPSLERPSPASPVRTASVETMLADVSDFDAGRVGGHAGRRALRPPRRADQQRRRALAERPDPQPDAPRTGSAPSGSTSSARSTASGPRWASCARSSRARSS